MNNQIYSWVSEYYACDARTLSLFLFEFHLIVTRLLSDLITNNKRTTNGQQADVK